jgi:hypothetical protein
MCGPVVEDFCPVCGSCPECDGNGDDRPDRELIAKLRAEVGA